MFSSSSSDLFHPLKAMAAVVLLAMMSAVTFTVQAVGSCEGTSLDDALAVVRDSTNQLFAAAKAYDGVLSEDPARARDLIDEIITPHLDLKGFSKLVLGKHWRRATPEQQKRFLTHFHALALRSYATVLTANTEIPIKYLPMREESRENFATVRTVIDLAQGNGVKVNYRLYCRNNVWKLFDVNIAGISMVITIRSALLAEVKRSGLDGLIKVLERKSKEVGT
jgi:phospholipid transport system substrate-binding protein